MRNLRVLIARSVGGDQLTSQVEGEPNAMFGPAALIVSSLPFMLMAAIW